MATSSELLVAIDGGASNQTQVAKLEGLLRKNLEAELRRTRPEDDADGDEWDKWNYLAFRGYAGLNWEGADREARWAIELAPDDPDNLLAMAPLLLLVGETEEYRQLCVQLLDAPVDDSAERRASIDNWNVRLCGLDPMAAGDPERVLELAQKGMSPPNDEHYYFIYPLGRAYYRAGRYEDAIETLERALSQASGEDGEPVVCLDWPFRTYHWAL